MATQGERLEALEKENEELKSAVAALTDKLSDVERILKDGETLDELRSLAAMAAPLSDFEAVAERLTELETRVDGIIADNHALEGGQPITAELVEGYDPRGDLLKAFRQIEAVANHINVKLPA